ncbi:hypothetical protein ACFQZQ_03930 [Lysobacter koreensis]|uniref:Uncharacterized protein n=2 Tax=Lysobacter koreensis TaxID=266122 RepID=A0ABW2YJ32_9GAMM
MAFQAQAEQALVTGPTTAKVKAQLDFRIVIPETLHAGTRDQQRRRSRQVVTRSTEVRGDRIVTTFARF